MRNIISILIVAIFLFWTGYLFGQQSIKDLYMVSDSRTISVDEALGIIDKSRLSHQFYIDQPEYQNATSGDTALNKEWVENNNQLENLIKTMFNELREFKE